MDVERAVHWFEIKLLPFDFNRGVHVFAVADQMSAGFPKSSTPNVWGIDEFIAILLVFISPEILNNFSYLAAFGMSQDQPWTYLVVDAEKVKFAPQTAVVAFLGFFQTSEIFLQVFFVLPDGAVNAL